MNILNIFTKLLHYFPSEMAHNIALYGLKLLHVTGLLNYFLDYKNKLQTQEDQVVLSSKLVLKNRIGIAAGLDKNGDFIDCLGALGVGFIEIGTVTPRPQDGNPKPRIFRDKEEKALINRLGFNNKGVDYLVERLKKRKTSIIVGTSIGKNFDTPNHRAHEDYLVCLEKVFQYTDYIAINISSPNTANLRELSQKNYLKYFLNEIKLKHDELTSLHGDRPVFIKISPDEDFDNLKEICLSILDTELDGMICTNTSADHKNKNGAGGLSGKPLRQKATEKLSFVKGIAGKDLNLIASGGVMSVSDYQEKINSGADLVQIYTGFIYEGPKLIKDLLNHQ